MAWTAPMTAVANAIFTASQFNTYVRDNLLETAPAKATTGGGYFVATGANAIAQRQTGAAFVNTNEGTTSTTYTDLTTSGPAVTLTTGTRALVIVGARALNASTNQSFMSYTVSGASSIAADDQRAFQIASGANVQGSYAVLHTDLTAGSNTFTSKYRSGSGTNAANFLVRRLTVIPF